MKDSRLRNHFSILLFVFIWINALSVFAGPEKTTYQAKIVKPDGYPLEASSVNFKFTILDPAGTCILYSETYSSVNMTSTGGLISFALGSGVKVYPASATTFAEVFSNIMPSLSCDTGGPVSYSPAASDTRKIVMQFHDGSGWQTLPAMSINAVPYAMYANEATKLNGLTSSDFVQISTVPTCTASEALRYTGASFSCVAVGNSVTSSTVVTALGYTPADGVSVTALTSNVSSVSSTVFSVSSTVTSLQNSVAASFAAITSSQWTTSGTNIFYNTGNIGIGTTTPVTTLDVSGGVRIGAESTTCAPALAGTLRYNASNVEYCNGTSWQAFGVSGSGITNFNGSTSGTQLFATGTGGTAPNFNTSNGVHSLNIPLASTGSVTAGLLSNADYATFTNKITSSAASIAQVLGYVPADNAASGTYAQKANNLSDLTNIATARTNLGLGTFATANTIDLGSASATGTLAIARLPSFTGDATIAAASNTIILSNSGVTAGTYTKVTVDAKGRVISSAALASSDVTTALGYTPANSATITSSQWTTSGTNIYYNSGNVGIGTAAPTQMLDVVKTTGDGFTRMKTDGADSDSGFIAQNDAQTWKVYNKAGYSDALVFEDVNASVQAMTIKKTTGNVGIGTTSPSNKLTVSGNANFTGNVGIGTTTPNGPLHIYGAGRPRIESSGNPAYLDLFGGFGNSSARNYSLSVNAAAIGNFDILQSPSSGIDPSIAVLSINASGSVGIGITNPSAKLHLASGTASVAPLKFTSGTLLTSSQSGTMEYDGFNFYLTDSTNTRRTIATGSSAGTIDNASNINSSSNITLTPTGSVIVSSTTASTNSATGALVVKGGLGVAGDIYTSGTIVTSSNIQGVSVTATSGMISPYIAGSIASGGSLTLDSTTHASKGNILLAPNGGNVGIGTTAPTQKLEVIGNQKIRLQVAGNSTGFEFLADSDFPKMIWKASDNSSRFTQSLDVDSNSNLDIYSFSSSSMNNILNLQGNGNVGIGVANPAAKLSVIGARQNTITPSNSIFQVGGDDVFLYVGAQPAGSYAVMLQAMRNSDSFSFPMALNPNGGNVGIGTVNPGAKLEVQDTNAIIKSTGTGGYGAFYAIGSGTNPSYLFLGNVTSGEQGRITSLDGGTLTFSNGTGAAERMRITSTGSVGIGTTSPTSVLDVRTSVSSSVKISDGAIEVQRDEASSFNTGGYIDLKKSPSEDYRVRMYYNSTAGASSEGGLSLATSTNGVSGSDKMFISANGNVGIGTTTPSTLNGWSRVLDVYAPNHSKIVATQAQAGVSVTAGIYSHGLVGNGYAGYPQSYGGVGLVGTETNHDLGLMTSNTTRVAITKDGNVGIGTTAPLQMLHVTNGSGTAADQTIAQIGSGAGSLFLTHNQPGISGNSKYESGWKYEGSGYASLIHFYTSGKMSFQTAVSGAAEAPVSFIERMVILNDSGNVGIGTASPQSKLHIYSNTNSVTPVIEGNDPYINSGLRFVDNGQSTAGKVKEWSIWHGRDGGTWASGLGFMRYDAVNPCSGGICDTSLFLHDNGNIGVGTMSPSERLHVAGNLRVQGSTDCTLGNGAGGTNCSSDVRLKENIKPIPYAIEKIVSLKGVEFDWNAKSISHGRHDIGVIAQDVEKVFPSAVIDDKNTGYKKVDYAVLVAPLIQAVKEIYNMIVGEKDRNVQQDHQIVQTENIVRKLAHENQELKAENAEKTKQLNDIRAYLCAKDPNAPICK